MGNGWGNYDEETRKTIRIEPIPNGFNIYGRGVIGSLFFNEFIFSHPFAKTLFVTDDGTAIDSQLFSGLPYWKCCLQQMVLYEDPIDYLREWLNELMKEKRNG